MEPIKPSDIEKLKPLPAEVIAAANDMITMKWNGKQSVFSRDELAIMIKRKFKESGKPLNKGADMSNTGWLDIEDTYRKAGWKVDFKDHGGNGSYT